MKHLLVLLPGFHGDGPGRLVLSLLRRWNPERLRVSLLALSGGGKLREQLTEEIRRLGGQVHVRPTPWKRLPGAAASIAREPWFRAVDALHAHLLRPDILARGLCRLTGLPTWTTEHGIHSWGDRGPLLRPLVGAWYCRSLPQGFRLVAISQKVQRDLLDVGIAHGQIDLIANGVEQVILPPREEARRALQLSGGEKVALLLGGLVAGKAPLLAKSAIERCKGWRLLVAGDGPLRDAIRGNSVRAVGFLEDPRLAFAAADLLLHPSYQESFGLAPLEGLAAGLPVVARAGSGLEDLLPPAPLATLVHGDSPQAWASAVECAGSLRSETLAGERRSWVATLFDANRCARAYEDLFAGRAEGKG